MKDIKAYIIGFLSATCIFLFMGHTSGSNSPIEVKIVEVPNISRLGTLDVEIIDQPTIQVEPKVYSGFKIKD